MPIPNDNYFLLYNKINSINSILDIDELLETVVDVALQITNGERGFIMFLEEGKDGYSHLSLKSARDNNKRNIERDYFSLNHSLCQEVSKTSQTVLFHNFKPDEIWNSESSGESSARDILCVPLKTKIFAQKDTNDTTCIGILYVDKRVDIGTPFSDVELRVLDSLADYAGDSIAKSQVYKKALIQCEEVAQTNERLRKRIQDLFGLVELSERLNTSLSVDVIVRDLLFTSMGNMGIKNGSVFLLDDETETRLILKASSGLEAESIRDIDFDVNGSFVRLLKNNLPFFIGDIDSFDNKLDIVDWEKLRRLNCVLTIPIMKENQLRGALNLGPRIGDKIFTEEEIEMLLVLVRHTSTALENARKYEDIVKKERVARKARTESQKWIEVISRGAMTKASEGETTIGKEKSEIARLKSEQIYKERVHEKGFGYFIGTSPAMLSVYDLIAKSAPYEVVILIRGESGTGKELVAEEIHYNSPRRDKPFVPINAGAIPKELFESEIFGHEKGSFTGAYTRKQGRLEMANGGTFFIDEVGELSLDAQVKLMRVLQEKEFYRVGGTTPIKVDFRLLCATNRNLEKMIKEGTFRQDFYYRINITSINLPPLRERKSDIPLLAQYFIDNCERETGKKVMGISGEALDILTEYPWPGNVREFFAVLQNSAIVCQKGIITKNDIPAYIRNYERNTLMEYTNEILSKMGNKEALKDFSPDDILKIALEQMSKKHDYKYILEKFEKLVIKQVIEKTGGNLSESSRLLNLSRNTLKKKMREYQLRK